MDESFEDLLLKYKQIQLELECINKDEKLAQNNKEETEHQDGAETADTEDQVAVEEDVSIIKDAIKEVSPEEKNQVITFQAFELKPLRQKLTTPAERSRLKKLKDGTKQLSQKSELGESSQGNYGIFPFSLPKDLSHFTRYFRILDLVRTGTSRHFKS